jgi:hypothetical protein
MADYTGIYDDDFSVKTFVRLRVYLVVNGSRENTSEAFDRDYLPNVYLNNVRSYTLKSPNCPIDTRLRFARLYVNSIDFVHVDLPFKPGSQNYDLFFTETSFNSLIITQGITGETIPPYSTRNKAR